MRGSFIVVGWIDRCHKTMSTGVHMCYALEVCTVILSVGLVHLLLLLSQVQLTGVTVQSGSDCRDRVFVDTSDFVFRTTGDNDEDDDNQKIFYNYYANMIKWYCLVT